MKKLLSVLLVLCMLTVTGLAFADDNITITIMHEHTEANAEVINSSKMFMRAQGEFLELHPNITIETTALGSSTELWDKLAVLAASNDLPDVIYLNSTIFGTVAPDGMLADLTGLVEDPSRYRDNLESFSYDGKVMALPVKATTYDYMFYDPEIWSKAGYDTIPTTWDEFIVACEAVRALGYVPVSMGNKTLWNVISNYLEPLIYELCGKDWVNSIVARDGKAAFTDDCYVEALTWLKKISVIWNADFNTADDQWAVGEYCKGKAAAHISGTWVPGSIKTYEADYPGISTKTRCCRIPTVSGDAPVIDASLPQALAVNAKLEGAKLEAAKEYVKYIAGESYSKHMAAVGEMGPVIVDIDLTQLLPMQQDLFGIMNSCDNERQVNSMVAPSVATEQQAAISSLLSGAMTPEEAAASIQAVYAQ